jgi:autotransporter passenger strand-loop-strand repeat protein
LAVASLIEGPATSIEEVDYGAADQGSIIGSGGLLEIADGGDPNNGSATGTGETVNSGGELRVDGPGIANNATINKGGNEFVDGTDNNATLSGGRQFIQRGNTPGVANETTILSGGLQQITGVAMARR